MNGIVAAITESYRERDGHMFGTIIIVGGSFAEIFDRLALLIF